MYGVCQTYTTSIYIFSDLSFLYTNLKNCKLTIITSINALVNISFVCILFGQIQAVLTHSSFKLPFPPSVSVNSGLFIDEIIYSYLPPSHPTQKNMLYKLALAQQPLTHILLKSKNPSPLPTNVEFHSFTSNLLIILLILIQFIDHTPHF